jgi:hypothetical protein
VRSIVIFETVGVAGNRIDGRLPDEEYSLKRCGLRAIRIRTKQHIRNARDGLTVAGRIKPAMKKTFAIALFMFASAAAFAQPYHRHYHHHHHHHYHHRHRRPVVVIRPN